MECNVNCSRAFECHNALTTFNGMVKRVHDRLTAGEINDAIRACDDLSEEIKRINNIVTGR